MVTFRAPRESCATSSAKNKPLASEASGICITMVRGGRLGEAVLLIGCALWIGCALHAAKPARAASAAASVTVVRRAAVVLVLMPSRCLISVPVTALDGYCA